MVESSTRSEMETDLLLHVIQSLARVEEKIDAMQKTKSESTWMNSEEFSQLIGTTRTAVQKAVEKGKIHGDAIRNIGTAKRGTFRFHRIKAVDQYLKRLPTT